MTDHRAHFLQAIRRQRPERLTLDLGTTPPVYSMLERHAGTPDLVEAFDLSFRWLYPAYDYDDAPWRAAYRELGVDLPENAMVGWAGVTHLRPPVASLGSATHLTEMLHPLARIDSVKHLEYLPFPDVSKPELYSHFGDQIAQIKAQGRVAVGSMECTVFELAWYLRGMENLFMDLVDGEGISDWLLDWFTERAVCAVRAYASAGVDAIRLGDDVGTQRGMMMAVPFWRRHLKPRLAKVVRAVREAQLEPVWVAYHSDGDVREILDDLIEIGIDGLNPVQPECMDPREVAGRWGDRLGLWGLIGTQTTMPFGTVEDVRAAVAEAKALSDEGHAILLAPTHVLEPDVPLANILALVEAVRG